MRGASPFEQTLRVGRGWSVGRTKFDAEEWPEDQRRAPERTFSPSGAVTTSRKASWPGNSGASAAQRRTPDAGLIADHRPQIKRRPACW